MRIINKSVAKKCDDDFMTISETDKELLASDYHFQSFHEIIRWYMNFPERITVDELSSRTGIAERTIKDMRSKRSENRRFELRYIIAVAVGLRMLPQQGEELVHLNGYYLRDTHKDEHIYKFLLSRCGQYTVSACNHFLMEQGLSPLSDNEILS